MQVKKFEARTMKEALEMVKSQLGPDAIILSAKDNSKKYGLVGESSFEITAAVSEETLHKKKFVESKMKEDDKNRFQSSPARMQKQIINKFVEKHSQQKITKPITSQRYIDIGEEKSAAEERIRNAAQRAFDAFEFQEEKISSEVTNTEKLRPRTKEQSVQNTEISLLKNEILSLKQMLSEFQSASFQKNSFQNTSEMKNISGFQNYPGSQYAIHYDLSGSYQFLMKEGVTEEISADMILEIQNQIPVTKLKNKSLIEGLLAKKILDSISISENKDKKFHFFVGPSGTGKTSTLIKMASHLLVRENKKVAILTTDNQKVGAMEQLRIYSQILNVPFAVIREKKDWKEILKFINSIDYILVDFPGLSLKFPQEQNFFNHLIVNEIPSKAIHLVLSARSKLGDLKEIMIKYSMINIDDVIFNHVDESIQNGHIYSFVKEYDVPLHSFGIGQRIPEDFEYATKERLVDLIFHITKKSNNLSSSSQTTDIKTTEINS